MSAHISGEHVDSTANTQGTTVMDLPWKVHTPNLLQEILVNPGTGMLRIPLSILGNLLAQVSERAIALDDPELNALMCRLTLYSVADPSSPDFDPAALDAVLAAAGHQRHKLHEGPTPG